MTAPQDPLDFIHKPDWATHDRSAARARLDATVNLARERRLELGARRFRPPDNLLAALNAALASRSPLLLTGDPGTGKTTSAYFLSEYFGLDRPLHFQVRSDSTARDLRHDFDAVAYLQDAYVQAGADPAKRQRRFSAKRSTNDPRANPRYLKQGMLWRAYARSEECVLLIDEIDKAPRDFPNDLLQELSDQRFAHPFDGPEVVNQGPPPMVVITSNGERRLPDPFLRRCIVCHIAMTPELLQDILDAWDGNYADQLQTGVRDRLIPSFQRVWDRTKEQGRPPGIAEFLVWINVLAVRGIQATALEVNKLGELPGIECLIKEPDDYGLLD